ncbi:hypothetical protein PS040_17030 [Escherichia albertii]|uniref:hypothetical protein n=1 Tax=Escherichia albertii TaxID=208962 RepID=UPI002362A921|nr:hypothetical protein [Escherichia albertii]WDC10123.1 hypothetical protein PS040_17030 [Escherichia albertii]
MSDASLVKIIEDLNNRVSKLSTENLALQQVIISIISAMSPEQVSQAKKHLDEIIQFIEKEGTAAAIDVLEVQKPIYQMLFAHVK